MYLTYFKREFAKKHGNSGVLARFVLFLSGIAIETNFSRFPFWGRLSRFIWRACPKGESERRTVNVFYEIKLHALFQPTKRAKNYRERNEKIRRDSHSDV